MNSDIRRQIIEKWTDNVSFREKVITLMEKVRDIPYGSTGSREPLDVYRSNEGTCSGKHELLKELYKELGLEIQDYIAMHRFKDMSIEYPEHMRAILDRSDIVDPHNFFKVKIDGKWLKVDVTWDKPLKKYGFIVNENWQADTDMEITVVPLGIYETDDPIAFKKQEIAKLSEQVQQDRKLFLDGLTRWVKALRVQG